MGQSKPFRAMALIVEDDPMQRDMICLLLEESELDVIECESAEAAELVLERAAGSLVLMLTDVQLAGNMDGVELAHIARKYNPEMGVIVTSGKPLHQELPDGVQFWSKPWAPLDVIREAERMVYERRRHDEAGRPLGDYRALAAALAEEARARAAAEARVRELEAELRRLRGEAS